MPGIAGIINKKVGEENKKDLRLMIECMMHEPFYTSGTYVNDKVGLFAGWTCHRGSFSDCMPVFNEKRDIVLLFSGENFADREFIDQLKSHGHEFDDFNASYLIHLYEEEEDRFFKHLNGWFSGILVDLRKEKVVLFNDRYGMHRIYYHESKDEILFSCEAKSLLKVRPELREIDMKSLGEFFSFNCILQNRTLFSNIFLLPGGSVWTFRSAINIKKEYYFRPRMWENQPVLGKETFYRKLRETFLNILPRYFYAKEPIAMSLTSGLDTRVIISCLNNPPGELPCYTFSGMYRDTFDVCIARKIADTCHQPHKVIRLDGKFLSDFSKLAEKTVYITDGCHDILGTHDIYFNRYARDIAPIRITGKFGSEVLGTWSMLKKEISLCEKLFHPDFKKYVKEATTTFTEIKKGHKLSFAVFKEMPWHEHGRLALEMSKLIVRTPYMDNDLVELLYQAPEDARVSKRNASSEIRLRLLEEVGNPSVSKIMTDRGTAGKSNHLLSKLKQLLCYSLFKTEYIYLFQLPHWLIKLDHIFASLHPERLILGRYQFTHYRIWFCNEISYYVREILLDKRTADRPYLNKRFLKEIVDGHLKGNRNYVNEINKILTAELIHRYLIEEI